MGRPRKKNKAIDAGELMPATYHINGECKLAKLRTIKEVGNDIYLTYGLALEDALKLALMLLVKGFPTDYNQYADFLTVRNLNAENCLSIFDEAFKKKLITCNNEFYASAAEAWGENPEVIRAEIPGTDQHINLTVAVSKDLKQKAKIKILENRCDCCLHIGRKSNMLYCNKCNQFCRNIRTCPEGIGVN